MHRHVRLALLLLLPQAAHAADSVAYVAQVGMHAVVAEPVGMTYLAGSATPVYLTGDITLVTEGTHELIRREFRDNTANLVRWTYDNGQHWLHVDQSGRSNVVIANQQGRDQRMEISQAGSGNHVSAYQAGAGNSVVIVQR